MGLIALFQGRVLKTSEGRAFGKSEINQRRTAQTAVSLTDANKNDKVEGE